MLTINRWAAVSGILVTVAVAASSAQVPQARQAQSSAGALNALLLASPGTYVISGTALAPSADATGLSVFVQPDVYTRGQSGVEVTIAIGAQVPGPWAGRLRISRTGAATAEKPVAEEALSGAAGPVRQSSRFSIEPGTYELSLALIAEAPGSRSVGAVVRRPLTVLNTAAPTLASTPVVLGDTATYLTVPERTRPFVFGTTQLTPAASNQFRQSDELHFACRVYGWKGDANAKPDLSVEYVFQERLRDRVRFFNKTKPQELNAKTLAKTFDGKAGAIAVGMSVPLGAFPAGEFDLVVRIKDKRTQATTIQKATFVVRTS